MLALQMNCGRADGQARGACAEVQFPLESVDLRAGTSFGSLRIQDLNA